MIYKRFTVLVFSLLTLEILGAFQIVATGFGPCGHRPRLSHSWCPHQQLVAVTSDIHRILKAPKIY